MRDAESLLREFSDVASEIYFARTALQMTKFPPYGYITLSDGRRLKAMDCLEEYQRRAEELRTHINNPPTEVGGILN